MKLLAGTKLSNNRYEVNSCLGEGGFGITYLATDLQLDRTVVLKEFFPRFMVNRNVTETNNLTIFSNESLDFNKGLDRFLSEAKTLALLKDIPEIVSVYDFFKENNTAYIVMEHIQGQNLKQYIRSRQQPYTLEEAMAIMRPCMVALGKVHEAGLIHRDFTPDNIIISDKGVKIIDFGSSREFVKNEATMTVMVKHGYAPVEQYSNDVKQGTYTDIYSVSAIIYEMLTLKKPMSALDRVMNDALLPPSAYNGSVDANQDNLVMKGLAVYYTGRYQSIDEMVYWYDGVMYGNATMASEKRGGAKTGKILGIIAGIAAALVVTGVGIFIGGKLTSSDNTETTKIEDREYDTESGIEKKKDIADAEPLASEETAASEATENAEPSESASDAIVTAPDVTIVAMTDMVAEGDTIQLDYYKSTLKMDSSSITWRLIDNNVDASVSSTGELTCAKAGTITVAGDRNGEVGACDIVVFSKDIKSGMKMEYTGSTVSVLYSSSDGEDIVFNISGDIPSQFDMHWYPSPELTDIELSPKGVTDKQLTVNVKKGTLGNSGKISIFLTEKGNPQNVIAYADAYVKIVDENEVSSSSTDFKYVKIIGGNTNVRSTSSTYADRVGNAKEGEVFAVIDVVKDNGGVSWVCIDYNGTEGYIRSDFVTEATEKEFIDQK